MKTPYTTTKYRLLSYSWTCISTNECICISGLQMENAYLSFHIWSDHFLIGT